MKKLLKSTLKVIILIFIIGFLFIQYLISDFNNPFDEFRLNELKSEIKKAEPVPADFIEIYNKVNPITNTNGILLDAFKENYGRECPCLNLARLSGLYSNNKLLGNDYTLAWKLEKEFTQEQCFNFYSKIYDFTYNNIGLYSASEFFFKKPLNKLNYEQMATLAIMFQNSSLYNPIRNPEGIKQKLSELKN